MLPLLGWTADDRIHLDRLVEYDKENCAKILQAAELPDLWNWFLRGQTNLYFSQESALLSKLLCWRGARNVLELGSGNGVYLSRLSELFRDKSFLGVEIDPAFVEQAQAQFERDRLTFLQGDAEKECKGCINQFDAVLYRLTLQHLNNPRLSLTLAHRYLTQGGYVIIIDSYDPAKSRSHEMPIFEEALRQFNERMRIKGKGNRYITIEILEELQNRNSSLSELYEVVHTNLDVQGNLLEQGIRFESEEDRTRCFNHALLFLSIMKKGYEVEVNLSEAYSGLQDYFEDENTWICPGMHLLVLRKI